MGAAGYFMVCENRHLFYWLDKGNPNGESVEQFQQRLDEAEAKGCGCGAKCAHVQAHYGEWDDVDISWTCIGHDKIHGDMEIMVRDPDGLFDQFGQLSMLMLSTTDGQEKERLANEAMGLMVLIKQL